MITKCSARDTIFYLAHAPYIPTTEVRTPVADNIVHSKYKSLPRPAFSRVSDLDISYLPYGELERNRDAMAKFGTGLKAIKAISRKIG